MELFDKYANAQTVQDLRAARKLAKPDDKAGDMVYENALLFLRDALNIRELIRATKQGDPGCIMLMMKVFALSFRGSGRAQYAFEALSFIHLAQKTVYNAAGSNASWNWIETISPCTEALGAKHTNPDILLDIAKLIRSLETHGVYHQHDGRTFDDEDEPAPDAESVRLQKLLDGQSSGLSEYNQLFKSTQEAHRQPVVSEMVSHTSLPREPLSSAPQVAPTQSHVDPEQETQIRDQVHEGEESESDGSAEAEDDDVGPGSDHGAVDPAAQEVAENDQIDGYEHYWLDYEDNTMLDDLEIFNE